MANKFQKSIQERQKTTANNEPATPRESYTAAETSPTPQVDLSAWISTPPQRAAKNKTFYLDTDVISEIKRQAKKQGTTESKLINDILKNILGLNN